MWANPSATVNDGSDGLFRVSLTKAAQVLPFLAKRFRNHDGLATRGVFRMETSDKISRKSRAWLIRRVNKKSPVKAPKKWFEGSESPIVMSSLIKFFVNSWEYSPGNPAKLLDAHAWPKGALGELTTLDKIGLSNIVSRMVDPERAAYQQLFELLHDVHVYAAEGTLMNADNLARMFYPNLVTLRIDPSNPLACFPTDRDFGPLAYLIINSPALFSGKYSLSKPSRNLRGDFLGGSPAGPSVPPTLGGRVFLEIYEPPLDGSQDNDAWPDAKPDPLPDPQPNVKPNIRLDKTKQIIFVDEGSDEQFDVHIDILHLGQVLGPQTPGVLLNARNSDDPFQGPEETTQTLIRLYAHWRETFGDLQFVTLEKFSKNFFKKEMMGLSRPSSWRGKNVSFDAYCYHLTQDPCLEIMIPSHYYDQPSFTHGFCFYMSKDPGLFHRVFFTRIVGTTVAGGQPSYSAQASFFDLTSDSKLEHRSSIDSPHYVWFLTNTSHGLVQFRCSRFDLYLTGLYELMKAIKSVLFVLRTSSPAGHNTHRFQLVPLQPGAAPGDVLCTACQKTFAADQVVLSHPDALICKGRSVRKIPVPEDLEEDLSVTGALAREFLSLRTFGTHYYDAFEEDRHRSTSLHLHLSDGAPASSSSARVRKLPRIWTHQTPISPFSNDPLMLIAFRQSLPPAHDFAGPYHAWYIPLPSADADIFAVPSANWLAVELNIRKTIIVMKGLSSQDCPPIDQFAIVDVHPVTASSRYFVASQGSHHFAIGFQLSRTGAESAHERNKSCLDFYRNIKAELDENEFELSLRPSGCEGSHDSINDATELPDSRNPDFDPVQISAYIKGLLQPLLPPTQHQLSTRQLEDLVALMPVSAYVHIVTRFLLSHLAKLSPHFIPVSNSHTPLLDVTLNFLDCSFLGTMSFDLLFLNERAQCPVSSSSVAPASAPSDTLSFSCQISFESRRLAEIGFGPAGQPLHFSLRVNECRLSQADPSLVPHLATLLPISVCPVSGLSVRCPDPAALAASSSEIGDQGNFAPIPFVLPSPLPSSNACIPSRCAVLLLSHGLLPQQIKLVSTYQSSDPANTSCFPPVTVREGVNVAPALVTCDTSIESSLPSRRGNFSHADVFVLCFAVDSPASLSHLDSILLQITLVRPKAPVVLLGLRTGTRTIPSVDLATMLDKINAHLKIMNASQRGPIVTPYLEIDPSQTTDVTGAIEIAVHHAISGFHDPSKQVKSSISRFFQRPSSSKMHV